MDELTIWQIGLAMGISFIGSILQGSVGFGLGLFAVPLLVIIDHKFVPGPLLLAAVVLTILMYLRDRSEVKLKEFTWAALGRVIGTLSGAYFLTIFPIRHLKLLFAVLVIIAVLISVAGIKLTLNWKNLLGAGIVSGFMATVAAIGGAPMALVYQYQKGPKLRGTLAAIFILGTIIALISLTTIGRFTVADIYRALILIPGVVAGFFLSRRTALFLDRGYLRPVILIITTGAALALIVEQVIL
ncbi:MAG: sulfite exporter TauE/SafE family protein [Calditrichaeota bacterium]|nr:sulfite exporter TauE/SafE family protein [Calditrichota bacterium]